jgi:hypothetical protein
MRDLAQVEALAELLIFDDAEFVERAYVAILGRQPEAHERNRCLERLLNGTSKDAILTSLVSSKDDRASAAKPRDADTLPLLQRTLHAITHPVTDALRSLDSNLNAKAEEQQKLLVQINQTVLALSHAAARMPAMPVGEIHTATHTDPRVLQEQEILQQLDSASTYFARNT